MQSLRRSCLPWQVSVDLQMRSCPQLAQGGGHSGEQFVGQGCGSLLSAVVHKGKIPGLSCVAVPSQWKAFACHVSSCVKFQRNDNLQSPPPKAFPMQADVSHCFSSWTHIRCKLPSGPHPSQNHLERWSKKATCLQGVGTPHSQTCYSNPKSSAQGAISQKSCHPSRAFLKAWDTCPAMSAHFIFIPRITQILSFREWSA